MLLVMIVKEQTCISRHVSVSDENANFFSCINIDFVLFTIGRCLIFLQIDTKVKTMPLQSILSSIIMHRASLQKQKDPRLVFVRGLVQ